MRAWNTASLHPLARPRDEIKDAEILMDLQVDRSFSACLRVMKSYRSHILTVYTSPLVMLYNAATLINLNLLVYRQKSTVEMHYWR